MLPKGHIEPGETAEEAAVREVREESGVEASIIEPLGDMTLSVGSERQRIRFFLMEAGGGEGPAEGRRVLWLRPAEASGQLSFPESRELLRAADQALATRSRGS